MVGGRVVTGGVFVDVGALAAGTGNRVVVVLRTGTLRFVRRATASAEPEPAVPTVAPKPTASETDNHRRFRCGRAEWNPLCTAEPPALSSAKTDQNLIRVGNVHPCRTHHQTVTDSVREPVWPSGLGAPAVQPRSSRRPAFRRRSRWCSREIVASRSTSCVAALIGSWRARDKRPPRISRINWWAS